MSHIGKNYHCQNDADPKQHQYHPQIRHVTLQSFKKWKQISFEERQKYFAKLSEILRARKQKFGEIITQEMKKPISQSVAEIEKCATLCDYYAVAENVLKPEIFLSFFKRNIFPSSEGLLRLL